MPMQQLRDLPCHGLPGMPQLGPLPGIEASQLFRGAVGSRAMCQLLLVPRHLPLPVAKVLEQFPSAQVDGLCPAGNARRQV
jgi:hypothetical protein